MPCLWPLTCRAAVQARKRYDTITGTLTLKAPAHPPFTGGKAIRNIFQTRNSLLFQHVAQATKLNRERGDESPLDPFPV